MLCMTPSARAAALLLAVTVAIPLCAQSASDQLVITGARVNFLATPNTITISGRNFGTETPMVKLQDTALVVTSSLTS